MIVFHALSREQIREIVKLQLERVRRTAHGQGVTLEFDGSLLDHLAEVGYQPEFGARELKRRIRQEVETRLAAAMLNGEILEGDTARIRYDRDAGRVVIETTPTGHPAPGAAVHGAATHDAEQIEEETATTDAGTAVTGV